MSDKSIWKKALGLFVEYEGEANTAQDPDDMQSVMAETRQALNRLDASPPSVTPGSPSGAPLSSVVNNYIPMEEVEAALDAHNNDTNSTETQDFAALYDKVCKSSISVFKVEEILSQPELQSLPRETRAKAAAVALRAMGSSVAEIVQDAYFKDQVLDQAELTQRQKLQSQRQDNEAKIKAVQQEVDDFLKEKNAEIESLRDQNLKSDLQLQSWIEGKLKEERRIFDILSHFVETDAENITLGENHPD